MNQVKILLKSTMVALVLLGVAASTPATFAPTSLTIAGSSGQHDDLDAG